MLAEVDTSAATLGTATSKATYALEPLLADVLGVVALQLLTRGLNLVARELPCLRTD